MMTTKTVEDPTKAVEVHEEEIILITGEVQEAVIETMDIEVLLIAGGVVLAMAYRAKDGRHEDEMLADLAAEETIIGQVEVEMTMVVEEESVW